jgi:hypothetical protein
MEFGTFFGFEIVAPEEPDILDKESPQSPSAPEGRNKS